LEDYTGDYEHPGYGTFSVHRDAGGLRASFHESSGPLRHYHYDTFELTLQEWWLEIEAEISFVTNDRGEVAALSMPLEPCGQGHHLQARALPTVR
jgi:hypothetical protein